MGKAMKDHQVRGFTLLEISVVLIVVALISAIGLRTTSGMIETARTVSTERKLDQIELALSDFHKRFSRLPCPSPNTLSSTNVNFGKESDPGNCANPASGALRIFEINDGYDRVAEGGVPVRSLGLPDEMALDGWGRRISYSVMTAMTSENGFIAVNGREACGMDVLASSALTNIRSDNRAAYTLISSGANGHGAYDPSGTVLFTGSTNAAEHLNCRCNATAQVTSLTGSVMQEYSQSLSSATNVYDDIVRYKERWQLSSQTDDVSIASTRTLGMMIAYNNAAPIAYTKRCDRFDSIVTTGASLPSTQTTSFLGFTTTGNLLFSYSQASNCQLYSVNETSLTALSSPGGCPTWSVNNDVELTSDGFLAISSSTSPYLNLWKQSGSSFNALTTVSYDPISHNPGSQPNIIAVSKNADFIGMVRTLSSPYAYLYRRSTDGKLTRQTAPPLFDSSLTALTFSDDGRYMAGASSEGIIVWTYNDVLGVYGADSEKITTPLTNISSIDISPDGRYVAIAASGSGLQYDGSSPPVAIYMIRNNASFSNLELVELTEPPEEIIGQIGSYPTTAPMLSVQFTNDSMYLVAVEASTANDDARKVVVYKKQSALKFSYALGVDNVQGSSAPTAVALTR
jgi:prepilin-type N-terminal cleavage/methylation domain-containing protein